MAITIPNRDEVARVARMTDLAARNREVTLGYARFAARLRETLGEEATWPAMAVWASAQAGQTIRKEDLLRTLERRLGDTEEVRELVHGPVKLAAQVVLRGILEMDPFRRSSGAVARGNIKVYEEIGAEFARFLGEGSEVKAAGLGEAFAALREAMAQPPGKGRAELVLLANLRIGWHEQMRLQPEIEEAVDGSVWDLVEVKQRLVERLVPGGRLLNRMGERVEALLERAQKLVREIITERMMVIELPGETLRLGEDLTGQYPETLQRIEHPELAALIARVDPGADTLRASGARDWTDFAERMNFIAELFRSRQHQARLFEMPS